MRKRQCGGREVGAERQVAGKDAEGEKEVVGGREDDVGGGGDCPAGYLRDIDAAEPRGNRRLDVGVFRKSRTCPLSSWLVTLTCQNSAIPPISN
jgi:hypothetical protein